jgi:hypothetical protein
MRSHELAKSAWHSTDIFVRHFIREYLLCTQDTHLAVVECLSCVCMFVYLHAHKTTGMACSRAFRTHTSRSAHMHTFKVIAHLPKTLSTYTSKRTRNELPFFFGLRSILSYFFPRLTARRTHS